MTHHRLKCDPQPFYDLWGGIKKCEVRINDRDYQIGDFLFIGLFRDGEFVPEHDIEAEVIHIQTGYGLPKDIIVMSLNVIRGRIGGSWTYGAW